MMDYGHPIWRWSARAHVANLQLKKFKFLRFTTKTYWYISNQQILEDLEAHLSRTTSELAEDFCPKLAYAWAYSFGYLRPTGFDGTVTKVVWDLKQKR